MSRAALVAFLGVAACVPSERPRPPSCVLEVREVPTADGTGGDLELAFLLANPGRAVESGSYLHPIEDFELSVTAGGHPVAVKRPRSAARAAGARTTTPISLPPGGGIRLPTPVRLGFAGGDRAPATSAHLWLLEHERAPLELHADIVFDGLAPRRCPGEYRPSQK